MANESEHETLRTIAAYVTDLTQNKSPGTSPGLSNHREAATDGSATASLECLQPAFTGSARPLSGASRPFLPTPC